MATGHVPDHRQQRPAAAGGRPDAQVRAADKPFAVKRSSAAEVAGAAASGLTADVTAAFDMAADRYDAVGPAFAGPVAARLTELAGLRPGWRVLDAGCGAGAVLTRAVPGGAARRSRDRHRPGPPDAGAGRPGDRCPGPGRGGHAAAGRRVQAAAGPGQLRRGPGLAGAVPAARPGRGAAGLAGGAGAGRDAGVLPRASPTRAGLRSWPRWTPTPRPGPGSRPTCTGRGHWPRPRTCCGTAGSEAWPAWWRR